MTAPLSSLPAYVREGLAAWYILANVYPTESVVIGPAVVAGREDSAMFVRVHGLDDGVALAPMTSEENAAWFAPDGPDSFTEAMAAWNGAPVEERMAMVEASAIRPKAAFLLAIFCSRLPPPRSTT